MRRLPLHPFLIALLAAAGLVGCSPTQPIYLHDTGDLSYYLDRATDVEYPDVETCMLDEVTQARAPITVLDPDFDSFMDLTLEQAVSIALQNAKVLRGYGTPSLQGTRVAPGIDGLANGPAGAGTIYNVAVRESEPGFIGTPGQISGPGSVLTNTGLDVNQGVEAALADFDAQFTANAFWTRTDQPRNVNVNFLSGLDPLVFTQDQVQWQSEVAKKTANGTQIFFRNVNTYTENNIPLVTAGGFQNLDSWYQTSLEMEFRQPVLRGRGAFIQRMPIVISRIGTDQELANLEAQLQNFVTNVEIRYWDLYFAYRNLESAKTGRDAALVTWRILKDQFEARADVNIQQLAQAGEQYHFFDSQVIDAYNNLLNAEGSLRWLLGIASTDGQIIRPIDEANMAPIEFDWSGSLDEALNFRPELRQERWEVKKRELAVAYAKNSLLPELNVTALYRWLGLGNKYATNDDPHFPFADPTSGAWNELFGGNYQEFQFGADFRMPVGFRRELANVRNAQLKLARELARLEDMELDVSRELAEAIRAAAANQRLMHSAFNRWKETTIEEQHFKEITEEGLETLDVALDAQRRRAQAETSFYSALAEYNKSLALIHRRKGTILRYNGIAFDEGPWPGKAYQDASEYARRRGASRQVNYGWTRPQVISRGPVDDGYGEYYPADGADVWVDESTTMPVEQYDSYSPNEIDFGDYEEFEEVIPMDSNMELLQMLPSGAPAPTADAQANQLASPETAVRQVSYEAVSPASHPGRLPQELPAVHSKRPERMPETERPERQLPKPMAIQVQATSPSPNGTGAVTKTTEPVQPPVVHRATLDWERFGLTRPNQTDDNIQATIKRDE